MFGRIAALSIFPLLAVYACATGRAGAGQGSIDLAPDLYGTAADLRQLYEAGFALATAPLASERLRSKYWPLAGLQRFKEHWVRWAELRGNKYISLETAPTNAAWLAIVPPGHPALSSMKSTLEVDVGATINVVRIKPERITTHWAGIFLVHELSHLADRALGVQPMKPTCQQYLMGEVRAYGLELMTVNLLTQGAFIQALDRLLEHWRSASPQAIIRLVQTLDDDSRKVLDSVAGGGEPASDAEGRLRLGFYAIALLMRLAEVHNLGDDWLGAAIEALLVEHAGIECQVSHGSDALPNKRLQLALQTS